MTWHARLSHMVELPEGPLTLSNSAPSGDKDISLTRFILWNQYHRYHRLGCFKSCLACANLRSVKRCLIRLKLKWTETFWCYLFLMNDLIFSCDLQFKKWPCQSFFHFVPLVVHLCNFFTFKYPCNKNMRFYWPWLPAFEIVEGFRITRPYLLTVMLFCVRWLDGYGCGRVAGW